MPLVSVIMPVYNCRDYVRAAARSILDQTFADFELIAVDDGSTDGSLEELGDIRDPRLVLMKQPNSGYPAALNAALVRARGSLAARMDADDISFPQRLEKQVRFFQEHPEFSLLGTGHRRLTPRGRPVPGAPHANDSPWRELSWEDIFRGGQFADPSVMFRLDAARQAGGYRTYQRSGQDIDLWLRIVERGGRAAALREALYGWRMNLGSISHQKKGAANKIPRLLAQERRERGTDRVMRGESLDGLVTRQMESHAQRWRVWNLWEGARVCFGAADYRSGWDFVRAAAGAGSWNAGVLRKAGTTGVQLLRSLVSR